MRIIGIDPGYAILGYGVIDSDGKDYRLVECGAITTDKDASMPERLKIIYADLMEVIADLSPEIAVIEELFWGTNLKTAIGVGEARGAAIVAAANSGLKVYEYTPLQVKMALTGYGRSDKNQIQEMVKTFLGLKEKPKPDDAADALAIAICHAHSMVSVELIEKHTSD